MLRICSAVAFNAHPEVTSNLLPNWVLKDGGNREPSVTVKCATPASHGPVREPRLVGATPWMISLEGVTGLADPAHSGHSSPGRPRPGSSGLGSQKMVWVRAGCRTPGRVTRQAQAVI